MMHTSFGMALMKRLRFAALITVLPIFLLSLGIPCVSAKMLLRYHNGLLTLKTKDAPLKEILRQVSEKANLKWVAKGSLEKKVTFRCDKEPVHSALKKLLWDRSQYYFQYSAKQELMGVYVVGKSGSGDRNSRFNRNVRPDPEPVTAGTVSQEIPSENLPVTGDIVYSSMSSSNPETRLEAVEMLEEIGDQKAADLLTSLLGDVNEDVRVAAVEALGEIEDPESLGSLMELVNDENENVRVAAVEALGKFENDRALPSLINLLDDESEEVRIEALDALAEFRDPQIIEHLIPHLNDSNPGIRMRIAEFFGDMDTLVVKPHLESLLTDWDDGVREVAEEALENLHHP